MARRTTAHDIPVPLRPNRQKIAGSPLAADASRTDRLVAVLDQCTFAKDMADEIGETFLSYLLAMAIQESRSAMRHNPCARRHATDAM